LITNFNIMLQVVHVFLPPCTVTVIVLPSYDHPNVYTVPFQDGSIANYSDTILEATSTSITTSEVLLLPS